MIGKEPIDDMPKWIVFYGMPSQIKGYAHFDQSLSAHTYGEIIKSRSYGLNIYGYTYSFVALDGRRLPFWREHCPDYMWNPLTKRVFATEAEYEMFLMLNPQIDRRDLEKFE